VLTATDATQFAWEGDQIIGQAEHSLFTHFLVEGLRSGEADQDRDGWISLDEWYDYVFERVVIATPKQTPGKWSYKQQGELAIARNSRFSRFKPTDLPLELLDLIASRDAAQREAAIRWLSHLLAGAAPGPAVAAREALQRLVDDDSRRVATAAARALTGAVTESSAGFTAPPVVPTAAERAEAERTAEVERFAQTERLAAEQAAARQAEAERQAQAHAEAKRQTADRAAVAPRGATTDSTRASWPAGSGSTSRPRTWHPLAYLMAGAGFVALLALVWLFGHNALTTGMTTASATFTAMPTTRSTTPPTSIPSATWAPTSIPATTRAPNSPTPRSPSPTLTATETPTLTPSATPGLRDIAVSVAGSGNDNIDSLFPGFATGERTLGGVRFVIPASANKVTTHCEPDLPTAVQISTGDVPRPETLFVLINAGNTSANDTGKAIGGIQANFADGERQSYGLVLGFNVREWRISVEGTVTTASSGNLTEAYRGTTYAGDFGVIDMLALVIPEEHRLRTLTSLTLFDSTQELLGNDCPGIFILGIAVRARP
jgi:hypothetical protein